MKKKQNHDKWYYDEEKVAKVAIGVCLLCIFIFVDYWATASFLEQIVLFPIIAGLVIVILLGCDFLWGFLTPKNDNNIETFSLDTDDEIYDVKAYENTKDKEEHLNVKIIENNGCCYKEISSKIYVDGSLTSISLVGCKIYVNHERIISNYDTSDYDDILRYTSFLAKRLDTIHSTEILEEIKKILEYSIECEDNDIAPTTSSGNIVWKNTDIQIKERTKLGLLKFDVEHRIWEIKNNVGTYSSVPKTTSYVSFDNSFISNRITCPACGSEYVRKLSAFEQGLTAGMMAGMCGLPGVAMAPTWQCTKCGKQFRA